MTGPLDPAGSLAGTPPPDGRQLVIDTKLVARHRERLLEVAYLVKTLQVKGATCILCDRRDPAGERVLAALRRLDLCTLRGPVAALDREQLAALVCPELAEVQREVAALPPDAEVLVVLSRGTVVVQRDMRPGPLDGPQDKPSGLVTTGAECLDTIGSAWVGVALRPSTQQIFVVIKRPSKLFKREPGERVGAKLVAPWVLRSETRIHVMPDLMGGDGYGAVRGARIVRARSNHLFCDPLEVEAETLRAPARVDARTPINRRDSNSHAPTDLSGRSREDLAEQRIYQGAQTLFFGPLLC